MIWYILIRRLTSVVGHLRAALPKTRLVLLTVFPRGVSVRRGNEPVPWPNNYTAVRGQRWACGQGSATVRCGVSVTVPYSRVSQSLSQQ